MTNQDSPLSESDVEQIAQLADILEKSSFDFMKVEIGDLKVTLGKGDPPPLEDDSVKAAPPMAPLAPSSVPEPVQVSDAPRPETVADDGSQAIVTPMMGKFYAQSEPGAAPFVAVGDTVDEETTVALVEVMKTFTSVPAGVKGVISEICVANEDLVEFGQVMFRVKPT